MLSKLQVKIFTCISLRESPQLSIDFQKSLSLLNSDCNFSNNHRRVSLSCDSQYTLGHINLFKILIKAINFKIWVQFQRFLDYPKPVLRLLGLPVWDSYVSAVKETCSGPCQALLSLFQRVSFTHILILYLQTIYLHNISLFQILISCISPQENYFNMYLLFLSLLYSIGTILKAFVFRVYFFFQVWGKIQCHVYMCIYRSKAFNVCVCVYEKSMSAVCAQSSSPYRSSYLRLQSKTKTKTN